MTQSLNNMKSEARERFHREWPPHKLCCNGDYCLRNCGNEQQEKILSFLDQELDTLAEKMREELSAKIGQLKKENKRTTKWSDEYNYALNEIIALLEAYPKGDRVGGAGGDGRKLHGVEGCECADCGFRKEE